ncbi:MAG: prephenate dehydratase, partial [Phycisphaera sp.]
AIEAVWRELMSGSFALELPLRIGYLGPAGSFSHQAATKQFGSSVSFEDMRDIRAVFDEVARGHCHYGLVPIENSIGGGIVESLDAFTEHASKVTIYAEAQIEIHHALLANCEPGQIRRIHSKPEIFMQCRTWLATQYPQAELIPAASSSKAAMTAAQEFVQAEAIGAQPVAAAIGNALAGSIYGLNTIFENIEDRPGNVTRFLILGREQARRSGDDKTSIMFNTADKPGALVSVLSVFDSAGVNLTHIDKRPSRRQNWQYTFFIDAEGHRDDSALSEAIVEASGHCKDLSVLGSYPRSRRIL